MIHHLLSQIPYVPVDRPPIEIPRRPASQGYRRTDRSLQVEVPDYAGTLTPDSQRFDYVDVEDEDSI